MTQPLLRLALRLFVTPLLRQAGITCALTDLLLDGALGLIQFPLRLVGAHCHYLPELTSVPSVRIPVLDPAETSSGQPAGRLTPLGGQLDMVVVPFGEADLDEMVDVRLDVASIVGV